MSPEPEAVILRRVVRASPAAVFRAWTDPALIALWLAPGANVVEHAETDLRVGGAFRLETRGPDGARHRITGTYRTIEPGRRLEQTWIYDGPVALLCGPETLLCVALRPVAPDSTELTLTHRRIAQAEVRAAYRGDWPSCLDKLEAALG